MYGYWTWFTILVSIKVWRANVEENVGFEFRRFRLGRRKKAFLLYTFFFITDIIMITTTINYGYVTQSDMRNRDQSLIGLIMQDTVFIVSQIAYIYKTSGTVTSP